MMEQLLAHSPELYALLPSFLTKQNLHLKCLKHHAHNIALRARKNGKKLPERLRIARNWPLSDIPHRLGDFLSIVTRVFIVI